MIFQNAFNKDYDPALWEWKFDNNPFQPSGAPVIYVAEKSGEIAGAAALLPVPFQVNQQRLPFYWGTDLMVHPRFQGLGIAQAMYKHLSKKHEIIMSIGASEAALQLLLKKTSWFKMSGFKRLTCYLDPMPFLKNKIPIMGSMLCPLSKWLLKPFLAHPPGQDQLVSLREIKKIGPEFDQLWEEVAPYYPISVCRTRQYLQWRYQAEPDKKYTFYGLLKNKKLLGYFVLEFDRPLTKNGFSEGMLMELVANPGDNKTIAILVQGALRAAKDRGCHLVRCITTSGRETPYRRENFFDLPQWDIRFFGSADFNKISKKLINNPELWLITFGDSCF